MHIKNLIATFVVLFSVSCWAQDETENTIEVRVPASPIASYRERRAKTGYKFGFSTENLSPDSYRSPNDGSKFKDLYGKELIPLFQFSGGAQYNFSKASAGLGLIYGTGKLSTRVRDANGIMRDTSFSVVKKGFDATLTLDGLIPEPWAAPYVSAQAFIIDFSEQATLTKTSGSTSFSTALQVGGLIQLNWIDRESSRVAYNASGMENAFLDIYVIQYMSSLKTSDPNFSTPWTMGLGVKLEF